jgi:hypothetical protein
MSDRNFHRDRSYGLWLLVRGWGRWRRWGNPAEKNSPPSPMLSRSRWSHLADHSALSKDSRWSIRTLPARAIAPAVCSATHNLGQFSARPPYARAGLWLRSVSYLSVCAQCLRGTPVRAGAGTSFGGFATPWGQLATLSRPTATGSLIAAGLGGKGYANCANLTALVRL